MSDIEPQLASFGLPPQPPRSGFDKTKLLIPGAIVIAGMLISASVLYARMGAGQALIAGNDTVQEQAAPIDVNITDAPMLGDPAAPVTVVEFADFQCPYCERYFTNNESSLIAEYVNTGKVKFIWKDYAFLGPESKRASEAARCADAQGKFWPYHDYLYNHQGAENSGSFSDVNLKKFAKAVGLNQTTFTSCLDSGTYASAVTESTQYGSSIGVTGTPATFVDGRLIVGAVPYADIKSAIEAALNK